MNNYLLTYKDHFSNNIPRWNTIVKPFLLKKGGVVRVLDIEPVEGRSSIWILENIPNSHVTAISLNKKHLEHLQHNLKHFGDRAKIITATHLSRALSGLQEDSFDFIYIDSGKDARYTMEAAVMAFTLLRYKGMMVFDDYTTDHLHGQACPKPAIDHFADCYARYIKVIHATWQFILIKRTKPLTIKACRSEYYHENIDQI
jgi:predicted O-methyltransferase YrrM